MFFLREQKGLYLASLAVDTVALWGLRPPVVRNCFPKSCEQNAKQSRPTYGLLAAASAATQKPPLSPLHVRGGDIALLAQSVASLETNLALNLIKSKFMFSRHGSR